MRFSNSILCLVAAGATAGAALVGCGGSTATGGSGGASSSSSSNSSSGSGTNGTGGANNAPCAPTAACSATDKSCIGLVDNSGQKTFGLRMSELDLTKPDALTKGLVKKIVHDAVTPAVSTCGITGSATFSWLLQFDTTAGTLKTGGAKPVADETQGYSFDDEMITQGTSTFHIEPVTFMTTPDASGKFSVSTGADLLYVPIFLDAAGSSAVILPLHQARLTNSTLSSNQNCIGHYNAEGLDPTNNCDSDDTHPLFITGGQLDGYITLDEADTVVISQIGQTLCVLLSGDATTYGMKPAGSTTTVCKRDAGGKITYAGDWCASTNKAADSTCADAAQLGANFAASSVKINN